MSSGLDFFFLPQQFIEFSLDPAKFLLRFDFLLGAFYPPFLKDPKYV